MIHNGFYAAAQTMMAGAAFQADPATREAALKTFRKRIKDTGDLPDWMFTALGEIQASFPAGTSVRFRSSTNNEDLEGFNGAGLYESYTHHLDEGHFAKSAKQVWAGLSREQALELNGYMQTLHRHFKTLYRGNSTFAMEIEFKVTGDEKLVIKQARPWVD